MATQSTTAVLTPDQATPNGCAPGSTPSPLPIPHSDDPPPLRSVHTSNFSAILQEFDVSVLVSAYQAARLVMPTAASPIKAGE